MTYSKTISTMKKDGALISYWMSFPENERFPLGIGVTAYSLEDAFALVQQQGIEWPAQASRIDVRRGITVHDLDQSNVVPNIGPMQLRGVWYPVMNIGYGAPRDRLFNTFER